MKRDFLSLALFFCMRFSLLCILCILCVIVLFIVVQGILYIKPSLFEWEYNSQNVSMMPAIFNTLSIVFLSLGIAIPFGVFGAVFLSEYVRSGSLLGSIIDIAAETLVGIPSIVYGLFGFLVFVMLCGFNFSLLSCVFTLSIMILPIILRSSKEALNQVPTPYKEASYALGASKTRTIFTIILPAAMRGILAGIILSIGKIVGESAALLYTFGTIAQVAGFFDSGRSLSVHMYILASEGFHINEAYSVAMILIVIVCCINVSANFIVKHFLRR